MLTQLSLHETYLFVNKPGNLPAYTSPIYLEKGNYCIQAYFSSIQHQNLTPYRFVVDSPHITSTRLIWERNLDKKEKLMLV
jgi:hypothetical protein